METGEITTILLEREDVLIKRIVSTGQTTDWYNQTEDEFVMLLEGKAKLEFEERELTLSPGDTVLIKAHDKHRVSYTSSQPPCIWLCVFMKSKVAL